MSYLRSIPLLALGLCGLVVSQQASAEIKIGYVDFQKLMAEAPQVKSAMQALQNEFGPRQRDLVAMQNDLKSRDEKLAKDRGVRAIHGDAPYMRLEPDLVYEICLRSTGEVIITPGTRMAPPPANP